MSLNLLKNSTAFLYVTFFLVLIDVKAQQEDLLLLKAKDHAMQYYVSLPKGWSNTKTWPVLVVCEAAEKQYKENALRFIKARGERPYIIVAPFIVTNGNQGLRNPEIFPYTSDTWDQIDREGTCTFDLQGLDAVLKDVTQKYNGEARIHITGFEAGAHLAWAMTFLQPEKIKSIVVVAGNFRSRCLGEAILPVAGEHRNLPLINLVGSLDSSWSSGGRLYDQWLEGKTLAQRQGYVNITEHVIQDKGHRPMPEDVFIQIESLRQKSK
ncbi:MAG TPA: hypothetical protein PLG25_07160 [bacterium]|nr:hypothetical protein [bacterium]HMW35830.1 hypothetical protein [bacterium]HMY37389.1 hypothetical protein [bacterium]HMZ03906.1 hypothetical protein [bacterium]HND77565.1 hypothetical protein [bacterium]